MSGVSNVKLLYLLAIAGARQSVDIQSPYFVLDSVHARRAERRPSARRPHTHPDGGRQDDTKSVKAASRSAYDALLASGYVHLRVSADDDARQGSGRRSAAGR
jgi:phosphatidylserine/phosphatidylglycerophosphate/cardiolipin synthase-like enzyme